MKRILWPPSRLRPFGEPLEKFRKIPHLRVRKLYVWQGSLGPYDYPYTEQIASSPNAKDRSTLLFKEMEETNNWARLGAQLYFGWFTLLLTANGLATGWLFTRDRSMPPLAFLVFLVFIALNLMGIIATSRIRRHLLEAHHRIEEVIGTLTQHCVNGDHGFKHQSPVPLNAINAAFGFTSAALVMLMLFWTAVEVWLALEGLRTVAGQP